MDNNDIEMRDATEDEEEVDYELPNRLIIDYKRDVIKINKLLINECIIDYIGMDYEYLDNRNSELLTYREVKNVNYVFLMIIKTYYSKFKLYNIYFNGGEDIDNIAYDKEGNRTDERMYKYLNSNWWMYKDYNIENYKRDNFIALLICCAMFNEYVRKYNIYSVEEIYCVVIAVAWLVMKMEDDEYYGLYNVLCLFYNLRDRDDVFAKKYKYMTIGFIKNNNLTKKNKFIRNTFYDCNRYITRKMINDIELRLFCNCLNYNYYDFLRKYNIDKLKDMDFKYI